LVHFWQENQYSIFVIRRCPEQHNEWLVFHRRIFVCAIPPLPKAGFRRELTERILTSGEMFEGYGLQLHMRRCGRVTVHRQENWRTD